jgi:hypothetical protein
MSSLDVKTHNEDDAMAVAQLKTEVDLKEPIDAAPADTLSTPSKKSVTIERLILCIALFFPLFLATLDTSTSLRRHTNF